MPAIDFNSLLSQYKDQLIGGLAGGTVGAGALGAATHAEDGESPEETRQRRLQNTVIGGLSGAALGAGGTSVYKRLSAPPPPPTFGDRFTGAAESALNPTNPVGGSLLGVGLGTGVGLGLDLKDGKPISGPLDTAATQADTAANKWKTEYDTGLKDARQPLVDAHAANEAIHKAETAQELASIPKPLKTEPPDVHAAYAAQVQAVKEQRAKLWTEAVKKHEHGLAKVTGDLDLLQRGKDFAHDSAVLSGTSSRVGNNVLKMWAERKALRTSMRSAAVPMLFGKAKLLGALGAAIGGIGLPYGLNRMASNNPS